MLIPSLKSRITASTKVPPWGDFQIAGVRFIEAMKGRCILGDSMGVGKSYQTIAWLAVNPQIRPAVIVCPAIVKWKWQREFLQFADLSSTVLNGFKAFGVTVNLWKDEKGKGEAIETTRWHASNEKRKQWLDENWKRLEWLGQSEREYPNHLEQITILNYDIIGDWLPHLLTSVRPQAFVLDEFQKVRTAGIDRTECCQILARSCPHVVGLSGTPIVNRPIEFFNTLNMVAPEMFPSRTDYGFRFCAPRIVRGKWEYHGASNLKELHGLVSKVMIRRTLAEVLPELPKEVRTVIPVDIDNRKMYEAAKHAFIQWLTEKEGPEAARRAKGAEAIVKLGHLKKIVAIGKLTIVKDWITDFLEETGEKLVMFSVSKFVSQELAAQFPGSVVIIGTTPPPKRQGIIDQFQNDPKCRLFFGNIEAAGIGTTLTAANTVGFVQMGWTPAEHDQASSRILRIGTKGDKMNSFYFLGRNTVDEENWDLVEEKRKVVGQVVDGSATIPIATQIIDRWLGAGASQPIQQELFV